MTHYETITGTIYFSKKVSNSLEENGIYEYQNNEPRTGLYEVRIYLNDKFNLVTLLHPNKPFPKREDNHLFTYEMEYSELNLSFLKNLMQL